MPSFFLKTDIKTYRTQPLYDAGWVLTNYGINENLKLFRSYAPRPVPGALMEIGDKYCKSPALLLKNLSSQSLLSSLCHSIVREALYCKFAGIYLTFSNRCDATLLASNLARRLPQEMQLFVGESHVNHPAPPRCTPVWTFDFERSFVSQLSAFCEKNKERPLAVDLSPLAMVFPLPDLEQNPTRLPAADAPRLCAQKESPVFYDKVHLCRYATFWQDRKPAVCLFDTPETYLEKIRQLKGSPEIAFVFLDYAEAASLFDPELRGLFSAI